VSWASLQRFGVIGAVSVSHYVHFPSIKSIPDAELVAVCDSNAGRARQGAEKWNIKNWYTDHEEMFRKEKGRLDAVVVASPNAYHRDQTIAAAEAGVHAIVEKPLACTNTEAWEMVDACKRGKVRLMLGCNYRF
jgi:predicted dehydrogenase